MNGCRPLTDEEGMLLQHSLDGVCADRDMSLFLLAVKWAFCISELLSPHVGDVWQHGRVVERVTVARRHMKNKCEGRTVLLPPEAKAALATWLLTLLQMPGCTAQTFIFRSHKGVIGRLAPSKPGAFCMRQSPRTSSPERWGQMRCARRSPIGCTTSSTMTW